MPTPLYIAKADFFKTLGHPARIRVLELLAEREYAVHELLGEIEIEPSNLSHQLTVLRRSGLISQIRRDGQVFYSLSVPEVRDLLLAARHILQSVLVDQWELSKTLDHSHVLPVGEAR